jgi:hypothetical protein
VLDDVCLWGQTYPSLERGRPASFTAVRAAEYYVTPRSVASSGQLRIDGVRVGAAVFSLARGEHAVSWTGAAPAPRFSMLWLPRDREQLDPQPATLSAVDSRSR